MKKFIGLIIQEHRQYALFNYLIAGLVGIVVFLGPMLIVQFYPNDIFYNVYDIRFTVSMLTAMFIWILSIAMLVSSINRDIRTKEIWLHNSQTMYALIGAKIVYRGISLIALSFIAFIGLFFVGDLIVGTLTQYLLFGIACLYIVLMIYIFFSVIVLLLFALNKQLARYIGKLSYILNFFVVIFLLELTDRIPEFTFLKIGRIELSSLNVYFPKFSYNNFNISFLHDFYLVEEIIVSGVLILIYMLVCKWIERVITR